MTSFAAGVLRSAWRECGFLRRDRWSLAVVSWFPALLLVVVAAVFSAGVMRDVPIAVVDHDHGAIGRELVAASTRRRACSSPPGPRRWTRPGRSCAAARSMRWSM